MTRCNLVHEQHSITPKKVHPELNCSLCTKGIPTSNEDHEARSGCTGSINQLALTFGTLLSSQGADAHPSWPLGRSGGNPRNVTRFGSRCQTARPDPASASGTRRTGRAPPLRVAPVRSERDRPSDPAGSAPRRSSATSSAVRTCLEGPHTCPVRRQGRRSPRLSGMICSSACQTQDRPVRSRRGPPQPSAGIGTGAGLVGSGRQS